MVDVRYETRRTVWIGLVVVAAGLVVIAPTIDPLVAPGTVDAMVSTLAWWLSAVLLTWLGLSLLAWRVVLAGDEPHRWAWLKFITVPGSRRIAEGLLTVGLLAGCSPTGSEVVAPRIEVLGPSKPLVQTPASTLADTSTLPSIERPLRTLVDTATLEPATSVAPPEPNAVKPNVVKPPEVAPDAEPPSAAAESNAEPGLNRLATTHEVECGDNLWSISAAYLAGQLGRPASNSEITPYWVKVVRANTHKITSGDPNLIYPGEVIELPSL